MTDIRADIPAEYKWDLSKIYKTEEDFDSDMRRASDLIEAFSSHEEDMTSTAESLYATFSDYYAIERILAKLYQYASRSFDVDTSQNKYQAMTGKVIDLYNKFGQVSYFVSPRLLRLDARTLDGYFRDYPELEYYRRSIEVEFRYKDHVLCDEGERVYSQLRRCMGMYDDIYSIFKNSDMKLGKVKGEDGKYTELTDANYISLLMSSERRVRRDAFRQMYKSFRQYKNTFATIMNGFVKEKTTTAQLRSFSDSITAATFSDEVTPEIPRNLMDTVEKNLAPLFEYYEHKRRMLGLRELHMYDLYVPLVSEFDRDYTYEEAIDITLDALKPLGEEYCSILESGIRERGWVDVYPSKAKRGGAYSSGCYDTEPYILMNFIGKFDDISTLAHEAGHSMHSYYSRRNNEPHESDYTIFVAEVASTVNELLLCNKRLRDSESDKERLSVLNHLMETYKGTLYRQSMFSRFEQRMHSLAEQGEPLTADLLCEEYYGIVKRYFGDGVAVDRDIECEWMRIPHFYYNFYVYKYATCICAASAIVKRIESEGESYVSKYIDFLSAGGSRSPIDSLLIAEIDLRRPEVIDDAIEMFSDTVRQFGEIYKRVKG
ncbi:MAG: oligoendopeptidase F [Clostridia bacterium]|nr:oligoendopeptidase F [Clostridia bacterium]